MQKEIRANLNFVVSDKLVLILQIQRVEDSYYTNDIFGVLVQTTSNKIKKEKKN